MEYSVVAVVTLEFRAEIWEEEFGDIRDIVEIGGFHEGFLLRDWKWDEDEGRARYVLESRRRYPSRIVAAAKGQVLWEEIERALRACYLSGRFAFLEISTWPAKLLFGPDPVHAQNEDTASTDRRDRGT